MLGNFVVFLPPSPASGLYLFHLCLKDRSPWVGEETSASGLGFWVFFFTVLLKREAMAISPTPPSGAVV